MFLLVPASSFAGFAPTDVVTLYSHFGSQGVDPPGFTGNFGTTAGFEEWSVRQVVEVPEPSTTLLTIMGLVTALGYIRSARRM
jgi:hypothetical protein